MAFILCGLKNSADLEKRLKHAAPTYWSSHLRFDGDKYDKQLYIHTKTSRGFGWFYKTSRSIKQLEGYNLFCATFEQYCYDYCYKYSSQFSVTYCNVSFESVAYLMMTCLSNFLELYSYSVIKVKDAVKIIDNLLDLENDTFLKLFEFCKHMASVAPEEFTEAFNKVRELSAQQGYNKFIVYFILNPKENEMGQIPDYSFINTYAKRLYYAFYKYIYSKTDIHITKEIIDRNITTKNLIRFYQINLAPALFNINNIQYITVSNNEKFSLYFKDDKTHKNGRIRLAHKNGPSVDISIYPDENFTNTDENQKFYRRKKLKEDDDIQTVKQYLSNKNWHSPKVGERLAQIWIDGSGSKVTDTHISRGKYYLPDTIISTLIQEKINVLYEVVN
ncbi:hypothetical protein [uncultured Shewanella sp.]|uniref:hypothetical protein n=1 Tax=uncultured Shewanella sp. TaxID=173975 RepID=UPI00263002E8|nr:hypothetical protein [uncultured Shewanella sp.]